MNTLGTVYPFKLEKFYYAFKRFKDHIEHQNHQRFRSFASNQITYSREGYKNDIFDLAQQTLEIPKWQESDIGSGIIVERLISAIEQKDNNLVPWQARYGEDKRPHQVLYKTRDDQQLLQHMERVIYQLYVEDDAFESIENLIELFGQRYPIIAYLYFIKDKDRYLPIAPTYFDKAFSIIGSGLSTSHQCSQENYSQFLEVIGGVRDLLAELLEANVSLLDAHSFLILLTDDAFKDEDVAIAQDTQTEPFSTEVEAKVLSRRGQGLFRKRLIDNWRGCSDGFEEHRVAYCITYQALETLYKRGET